MNSSQEELNSSANVFLFPARHTEDTVKLVAVVFISCRPVGCYLCFLRLASSV